MRTPPAPIIVSDPDDQLMWSSTRTVAPTPSSAIIQCPISTNFRIKEFLEFLIIRKELKETRDGRRDNHALQIYMKDDTPMCEPHEANYVQRYQGGYHDHEPINSYSYPNHNPNRHYPYPRNQMPRPSRYFKFTETSTKEMMREWMASQMKANERMKNQVVELENQVNQGLRNHQAIIQNLERQFEFLLPTKTLPPATNTKPRHEIVYNIPSIRNNNDKGDVKFIEVDETQPVPTMPNPNLIEANSPTVSPFSKDCTMHIPYTDAKTFADVVLLNHVGEKELKSIVGDGIGVLTQKKIKKNDMGLSKEPAMKWNMERKIDEWENYQNLSSKKTDRTNPLHPHAHTEQVNVVFTESGKSDDFPEIQIDQPSSIIVNNKIKKDKPIKTSKGGYHVQVMVKEDAWSPQSQENVPQAAETVTTSNELDFLFSPMFDELLNGTTKVVSKSSAINTVDAPDKRQQQNTTQSTTTTVAADISPLNIQTTPETTSQAPTQVPTVTATENIIQAETNKEYAQVDEDEFINIFSTPIQERGETSSRYVDSSNMHTFYQRHPSENR
ncbi:hypothetical protein Tco_1285497 [Tanacetum coccineum]